MKTSSLLILFMHYGRPSTTCFAPLASLYLLIHQLIYETFIFYFQEQFCGLLTIDCPTEEEFEQENVKEDPEQNSQDGESSKVDEGTCECISDNGIKQTKRNGQNVIIYTDASGAQHSYPSAYGTSCIGWDELLPPFCGKDGNPLPDQPSWCSQPWCYVDPDKCKKSDVEETAFFGEGTNLWYSYSTCNAEDLFSGTELSV